MSASTYDAALSRVLAHEGGYVNHPSDPGGPTNFGITIADYRRYAKPGATAADVRSMPLTVAKTIYAAKYWSAQRCNDLPPGVDYSVFDYGVNSGIGRSGKVLRRALGLSADTSVVSADVIRAAAKCDAALVVTVINSERLTFLKGLATWSVFGNGWGARVAEVKAFSLQLARGDRPVENPVITPASGRAFDPAEFATVRLLQNDLLTLGFDPGAQDGDMGPKTEAAIKSFQRTHHLKADGVAGPLTMAAIRKAVV